MSPRIRGLKGDPKALATVPGTRGIETAAAPGVRVPFPAVAIDDTLRIMADIEKHAPGDFSWIELGTTDQSAGKKFYTQLFGWTVNDVPMGPNDLYTMFELQGRPVAGAYTLRPEQKSQGVPPHWMLYVAVEDADVAANRVLN